MSGDNGLRFRKRVVATMVVFFMLAGPLPAYAAAMKEKPALPVEIVADELYFSDRTGELFAKGNLVVSQGSTQLFADMMRGNEKQTELWVDGKVRYMEPLSDMNGKKMYYNYGSRFGSIANIQGKCGDDFISGDKVDFQQGKYTVYGAATTGCPAKGVPDYRVTARKVVIWPNDKMVAYDAKVWLKNTVIYSTPRYKRSLKKNEEDDEFPRFGYQDTDGFWISQRFSYALSDNVSAYADIAYYTKLGFRPTFGVIDQEKNYTMKITTGRFRDDNSNWIRKEPEFRFDLYPQPIGKLPMKYTMGVVVGQWIDDIKSSWHQDYNLYVRHDPIYFDKDKSWQLDLGTGFQHIRESYDASQQNVFRYNAQLTKKLSPTLTVWTGYNYLDNNNTSFTYGRADVAREGIAGISWKVNKRTTISYYTSYDFANSRVYENYYRIKQNFHCWETDITYRSVKKELIWTVNIARW